jgi:hypothetical protein
MPVPPLPPEVEAEVEVSLLALAKLSNPQPTSPSTRLTPLHPTRPSPQTGSGNPRTTGAISTI